MIYSVSRTELNFLSGDMRTSGYRLNSGLLQNQAKDFNTHKHTQIIIHTHIIFTGMLQFSYYNSFSKVYMYQFVYRVHEDIKGSNTLTVFFLFILSHAIEKKSLRFVTDEVASFYIHLFSYDVCSDSV